MKKINLKKSLIVSLFIMLIVCGVFVSIKLINGKENVKNISIEEVNIEEFSDYLDENSRETKLVTAEKTKDSIILVFNKNIKISESFKDNLIKSNNVRVYEKENEVNILKIEENKNLLILYVDKINNKNRYIIVVEGRTILNGEGLPYESDIYLEL